MLDFKILACTPVLSEERNVAEWCANARRCAVWRYWCFFCMLRNRFGSTGNSGWTSRFRRKGVREEASLIPERVPQDLTATIPDEVLWLIWKWPLRMRYERTFMIDVYTSWSPHFYRLWDCRKQVVPESCVALNRRPEGPNGHSKRVPCNIVVITPLYVCIRYWYVNWTRRQYALISLWNTRFEAAFLHQDTETIVRTEHIYTLNYPTSNQPCGWNGTCLHQVSSSSSGTVNVWIITVATVEQDFDPYLLIQSPGCRIVKCDDCRATQ